MGANVAGIFASFGGSRVYYVRREVEKVKQAIPRIVRSVLADVIAYDLVPVGMNALRGCVAVSDLVFVSSAEGISVNQ